MSGIYELETVLHAELRKILPEDYEITTDIPGRGSEVYVNVRTDAHRWLGDFAITAFPGNSQVLIFNSACVNRAFRNQGWGRKFHQVRVAACQKVNARVLLCTVRLGNEPQERILTSEGWQVSPPMQSADGEHEWRLWRKVLA